MMRQGIEVVAFSLVGMVNFLYPTQNGNLWVKLRRVVVAGANWHESLFDQCPIRNDPCQNSFKSHPAKSGGSWLAPVMVVFRKMLLPATPADVPSVDRFLMAWTWYQWVFPVSVFHNATSNCLISSIRMDCLRKSFWATVSEAHGNSP